MYGDDLMKGDLPQSNDAMDQRYTPSSVLDNKVQCICRGLFKGRIVLL